MARLLCLTHLVLTLLVVNNITPTQTTESLASSNTKSTPAITILRHLQIIFRHGDRAPLNPLYPNDPFNSTTYWPHGLDQLTNTGRARAYRLGQMIREKYSDYLGQEFSPREVVARSSAVDRTVETAQLVLAGMF